MSEQLFTTPEKESFDKDQAIDTILIAAGLFFILLALLITLFYWGRPQLTGSAAAGSLNPTLAPVQERLYGLEPFLITTGLSEWTVQPRARYALSARVLHRKNYRDFQAGLVPFDLALGWGEMADTAVDEWISWRQSGRWYYYTWSADSPYDGRDIRTQSANVHIIPANENLKAALATVAEDDIIFLQGMLVDATTERSGTDFKLSTSLSRSDGGGGSCEIMYVEKVIVAGMVYE
jgi:hypothetical protein